MTLTVEPIRAGFAARLSGVDIRRGVDADGARDVIRALAAYPVCVIGHGTPPTNEQHVAFSSLLGPLERGPSPKIAGTGQRVPFNEIIEEFVRLMLRELDGIEP